MKVETTVIRSFREYIDYIEEKCSNSFTLYRGQSEDKPLLPKIARFVLNNSLKEDLKTTEKKMLKLLSPPYISVEPKDDWEWLAIAQHHGLVTRRIGLKIH